jgi:hypothetical protein
MVGDRSLAEDLTQEVFLASSRACRASRTLEVHDVALPGDEEPRLDELRATERRPRAVVDLDDIPPLEVVDAPFERLEAIDAVWRRSSGSAST